MSMTLNELLTEIDRIIKQSPYTKEQIVELLSAEPEMQPDELFALAAAVQYVTERKIGNKKLFSEYTKRRNKLMKYHK